MRLESKSRQKRRVKYDSFCVRADSFYEKLRRRGRGQ
jgi:hypothetical protein